MPNELQWRQIVLCFQRTIPVMRDHGLARLGNWTIALLPQATSALLVMILLGHFLFVAAGVSPSFAQAQSDAGSYSGVYFQIRGLDISGNPVDKLIYRFGFTCLDELREYNGGTCRVERELAAFVNSLSHNRKDVTEALTALGATCVGSSEKPIDCLYRKRARTFYRISGEPTPRAITDDIFVFHIKAPREQPFEAQVELTRTEETIK